jgi:hypothetical protein
MLGEEDTGKEEQEGNFRSGGVTCSKKTKVVANCVIHSTEKASPDPEERWAAGNSSEGSRHATGPRPMPKVPTKPTMEMTQTTGTHASPAWSRVRVSSAPESAMPATEPKRRTRRPAWSIKRTEMIVTITLHPFMAMAMAVAVSSKGEKGRGTGDDDEKLEALSMPEAFLGGGRLIWRRNGKEGGQRGKGVGDDVASVHGDCDGGGRLVWSGWWRGWNKVGAGSRMELRR